MGAAVALVAIRDHVTPRPGGRRRAGNAATRAASRTVRARTTETRAASTARLVPPAGRREMRDRAAGGAAVAEEDRVRAATDPRIRSARPKVDAPSRTTSTATARDRTRRRARMGRTRLRRRLRTGLPALPEARKAAFRSAGDAAGGAVEAPPRAPRPRT